MYRVHLELFGTRGFSDNDSQHLPDILYRALILIQELSKVLELGEISIP
jgi:hypothetical protein